MAARGPRARLLGVDGEKNRYGVADPRLHSRAVGTDALDLPTDWLRGRENAASRKRRMGASWRRPSGVRRRPPSSGTTTTRLRGPLPEGRYVCFVSGGEALTSSSWWTRS